MLCIQIHVGIFVREEFSEEFQIPNIFIWKSISNPWFYIRKLGKFRRGTQMFKPSISSDFITHYVWRVYITEIFVWRSQKLCQLSFTELKNKVIFAFAFLASSQTSAKLYDPPLYMRTPNCGLRQWLFVSSIYKYIYLNTNKKMLSIWNWIRGVFPPSPTKIKINK